MTFIIKYMKIISKKIGIRICQILYKRARYINEIDVFQMEKGPKEEEKLIIIFPTENDEPQIIFMSAYPCKRYIPKTEILITKYKIAAGPNNTSVLFLRETDCPKNEKIGSQFIYYIGRYYTECEEK